MLNTFTAAVTVEQGLPPEWSARGAGRSGHLGTYGMHAKC